MFDITLRKAFVKFRYSPLFFFFPPFLPFSQNTAWWGDNPPCLSSSLPPHDGVERPTSRGGKAAPRRPGVTRSTCAEDRNVKVRGLWESLWKMLSYNKVACFITATGMCWAEQSLRQQEDQFFWAESVLRASRQGGRARGNENSLFLFYQFPVVRKSRGWHHIVDRSVCWCAAFPWSSYWLFRNSRRYLHFLWAAAPLYLLFCPFLLFPFWLGVILNVQQCLLFEIIPKQQWKY